MRLRRTRRSAAVGLAACLCLLTSACGARWSDSQREQVLARNQGGGSGSTGRAATAATGGATTTVPSGTGAATSGGATSGVGATSGGDTTGGGGGAGDAGAGAAASGPLPCSAPSTAPGVSDSTITVGSISSLSGPIPGLGASAAAAARAYVSYLNANGGVCGRKVDLKTADDGTDNGTFRSVLTSMEPNILGLVGEDGGGDAGGADVVEAKQLPAVTTAFSTTFQNVSTVFDINPPYADTSQSIGKYRWLHDHGATKVALVYIAVDASRDQIKQTEQPLLEAAGIQVVNEQPLPLSTLNYDAAARAVANSGADYLLFLGGYEQNSNMATSMAGTGYKGLKFAEYFTTYGTSFIDQAGAAAEGATSWAFALPVEDGGANPEQATFIQWMKQTAPDAPMDVFADEAWAATKAFFQGLQQLPGPISRDALVNQMRTMTSYDADGFYGKINLGAKQNLGCYVGMQVVGGSWKRLAPDQGFLC